MKTITVRLVGGLGNQLHIYAFGRAIAHYNQAQLICDITSGYWNDPFHREYLLALFPTILIEQKKMPTHFLYRIFYKIKTKLGIYINQILPLSTRSFITETPSIGYQKSIHHTHYKHNPYFLGCWASYRYYEDIAEQLRIELRPPKPTNSLALALLDEIQTTNASCSIHWRSYEEENGFNPLLKTYYPKAISLMQQQYPNIHFFVFSDNPAKAETYLSSLTTQTMTYVNIKAAQGNQQSLIDFYLMHCTHHAIIGDSTFSWWAAWLSDTQDKTIIAPYGLSPWGRDWIPSHWISVDVISSFEDLGNNNFK